MKGKTYVTNAFSLNMVSHLNKAKIVVERKTVEEVRAILSSGDFISGVGHEGTALLMSKILGIPISVNRTFIKLEPGDLLVTITLNVRLPEGAVLSEQDLEVYKQNLQFYTVSLEIEETKENHPFEL